ncbi:uncharacterized protein APUU_11691A [Aspergillus puulaauensis]|uniref:Uncharacterized protein n=1 Tax=Aspergillus puulaauensis TaxID=1220207 RepID=A0A7R8AIV7_9EURO|nr:uncharacterized protein APUU_11691A [Aspergillus puulaauensis]BCS18863.1 hypothetical protein APUU_11691A [Aspergillus puulaauensis]
MTETSMPCDVPWGFDPMNPDTGFGVAGDEEMWYRNPYGMNSFDLPPWQPVDANQMAYEFASPAPGKTPFQQLSPIQTGGFPTSQSDKALPRFDNLPPDHGTPPYSLDDLLRTASQLATERALYMNIPSSANPHSPAAAGVYPNSSPVAEAAISSPSASPSHHSNASDTDEHDVPAIEFPQVYQLPDSNAGTSSAPSGYFAPMELPRQPASYDHVAAAATTTVTPQSKAPSSPSTSSLTPLEMPDGSTRFTANWLPVDPQGGFTIRSPAHHYHHHQHYPMDVEPDFMAMDYHDNSHTSYNYHNAFISLDNLDAGSG